jgi:hypothetical protein
MKKLNGRLNSGNACYHSVYNFKSSHFLSKNVNNKIYRTTKLCVVLYGYRTWCVTSREEHRLRKIFEPKRGEGTEGWRKLYNEELHDLYSSSNTHTIWVIKPRRMRWVEHVAPTGEKRNTYRALVRKLEGRRPPARPRLKWEDNIKMNVKQDDRARIGLNWITIGTSGGLF